MRDHELATFSLTGAFPRASCPLVRLCALSAAPMFAHSTGAASSARGGSLQLVTYPMGQREQGTPHRREWPGKVRYPSKS